MAKLTDTQRIVLSKAAAREDGALRRSSKFDQGRGGEGRLKSGRPQAYAGSQAEPEVFGSVRKTRRTD